jgi:hypothetical protein
MVIFWPDATVRELDAEVLPACAVLPLLLPCANAVAASASASAKVSPMNLTLLETLLIFISPLCESLSGNFARSRETPTAQRMHSLAPGFEPVGSSPKP